MGLKGKAAAYIADRPMTIAGRYTFERERLAGMTMEERTWRKKWLKDQELAPGEPVYVKELERELMNPIQRLYKVPLNYFFYHVTPKIVGVHVSAWGRRQIPRYVLAFIVFQGFMYWMLFCHRTWESNDGPSYYAAKPALYPGDPGYAQRKKLYPDDFSQHGFKYRTSWRNFDTTSTSLQFPE